MRFALCACAFAFARTKPLLALAISSAGAPLGGKAHMRVPDLSGLSLAPTGSRATHCDWRFGSCVTFDLVPDLFKRHADLVRELGITQGSCKVMLSAVSGAKARAVTPYETLYGSAWWNMLLIELGLDELQVLLSYYKTSRRAWRGIPLHRKWSKVNEGIESLYMPDGAHMHLRMRPLPADDDELARRVLVAMHVVNQGVKAMDAADPREKYPYLALVQNDALQVPNYGPEPAARERPAQPPPPAKRVRVARQEAKKAESNLLMEEALEAEFDALEQEEKERAAKAAFEEYLNAVGNRSPRAMDEGELPEPGELGWTAEELHAIMREEADSETEPIE